MFEELKDYIARDAYYLLIKVTVFKGMNLWSNFYFKYYEKNII